MIRRFGQICAVAAFVGAVGCGTAAPDGEENVAEAAQAIIGPDHVRVLGTTLKEEAGQLALVQYDEISAETYYAALAGEAWSLHATFFYTSVVGDFSWDESTRPVSDLQFLGESGGETVYVATWRYPSVEMDPYYGVHSIADIIGPDHEGPPGGPGNK